MNNPFETIDARLSNIESILLDLKHSNRGNQTTPETDQWFDLNQLCEYLPDKPAKATAYGWVHTGMIPHHKGQKKLRFLKSEIDQWLKTGKRKTYAETAIIAETYLQSKKRK
jgi:predicted DNA-binding transcriptional regulator AlpA